MGVPQYLVTVLSSWLERRKASVVLGGAASEEFELLNMLFQGTVLGPALWAIFFSDVCRALQQVGFEEVAFADDLSCQQDFPSSICDEMLWLAADRAQAAVHRWGRANSVHFDAAKEQQA